MHIKFNCNTKIQKIDIVADGLEFEKDGINLKNENNNKNDNINNNKNIKHLIYYKTIADLKKNKITKQNNKT